MAEGDAAFLWETEALRASRRKAAPADRPTRPPERGAEWVTLREAYYRTGIPIETLRKWARRAAVPSYLDETPLGVRRMVRMDAVRTRAADLGRPTAPVERPTPLEPPPAPPAPASREPERPAAAREPAGPGEHGEQPSPPRRSGGEPGLPPETMIVPVAAWDKMLMQLGNLHEAGQQLAEARERAAKAETEAAFLRERLGELRSELVRERAAESRDAAAPDPEANEPDRGEPPADEPRPGRTEKLWRYVYRGWRDRRR